MKTKPGIHQWREIYFSIDYDHDLKKFRAYFVHNNKARVSQESELIRTREQAENVDGLLMNHTLLSDNRGMLYWEFQKYDSNINVVLIHARKGIDFIRNWEEGEAVAV